MGLKIRFKDPDRARDCVQWCIEHIGPLIKGPTGTMLRGEGWNLIVNIDYNIGCLIDVELVEEHVDDQTALMFSLRWS